jgi:hypothetical protein
MSPINNTLSIEQLFAGRLFHVPIYQRGYSWETQQRSELVEDLDVLTQEREHYTGTVVLHEVSPATQALDSEGRSYGLVDIVDGQQRLATVVLLLDSIRRGLSALEDGAARALAQGIKRTYIAGTDIAGQPLFKLSLNDDCDHYFKSVAISDLPGPEGPQITSERRLADARNEFTRYVEDGHDSREPAYLDWLLSLYRKIAHQLRVSLYLVESAADVGVIFEVMNNRGKPLSELEKVKNYLLYAGSTFTVPHGLSHAVNDGWAEILRQLMAADLTESKDEDRLLRAHWLAAYYPQPRNWAGSKTIKSHFDLRHYRGNDDRLLSELLSYTDGLRSSCVAYCDASFPGRPDSFASMGPHSPTDEVRRWSEKLIRTNVVASFLPLLIATRIRFANDASKYLELVRLCEIFAFRVYRLLERRSDAGQADLFRIGNHLYGGSISFEEAIRQLRVALHQFSPDSWFEEALRREDYNWYAWAGLKYFLYEYEEYLAQRRGAVPRVAWDEVRRRERADTIEHILPQTPTDDYWFQRFDASARQLLTHDLGNLTLTKDNASYGNRPFPHKKGSPGLSRPCYAESPFFVEREVSVLPDWNPEELLRRRESLISWALERWRAPLDSTEHIPATPASADEATDESGSEGDEVSDQFSEVS